ncbi:outer membrane beta-barrel protein [Aequorivita capsosiphonis]|uniref:outer membrane beta-barrel protein n=1 Tax=Aequorivita capsosiphonis TaxID=487317 RepID=UPI000406B7BB|nr:outer membrane beta-barrel protein [Aequorivita capsosiphonis]
MSLKTSFIAVFFCIFFQQIYSQRNYEDYNFLGVQGGITFFDIKTDDLVTEQHSGFMAGFTTRGAFRNNFDLIYGISFQSASIGVEGSSFSGADTQNIAYTIQGAQINFLGSYNIIVKHLSLEFGPVLNINGKLKLDNEKFKDYVLTGYETLATEDIQDISKFNVHLAGGLTAGLEHFRIYGQYQYGVTNMLGKLNDKDLEKKDFKGNSSTILVGAVIYF